MGNDWVTIYEAAERLYTSYTRLYNAMRTGQLISVCPPGGRPMVNMEECKKFLEKREDNYARNGSCNAS